MWLRDMDVASFEPDIFLLQTPSNRLYLMLMDKLKAKYDVNSTAVVDIETKSDYKKIKEIIGISPPFSKKWFIQINLEKTNDKDLISLIKQSTTCLFFCTCSKYKTYKEFKKNFDRYSGFYDLYISFLKKPDFIYLYDAFVPTKNKLSYELFNYVSKSYSNDIESIFDLLLYLNQGGTIKNRQEITSLCGIGGLSIDSYIFDLLKPLSGSAKGLLLVIKRRLKAGLELGESVNFGSMYNFMSKSLFCLCELKMLKMSGVVYKDVRGLPDTFDEKTLVKYQKYLWKLNEIPMSSLLRLRKCMGKKQWKDEMDFTNFLYNYYFTNSLRLLTIQSKEN